jgi:hypothetical protein
MRKIYLLCCVLLCTAVANSQVTGTKTIGVDYPTIAAAITDLNAVGVGAGGATINVPGGYTETAPAGGYLLGSATLNASLSVTNPLVFQKSGAGANPLITAPVGTTTNLDGIFTFQGVDFMTIDGINLRESPANITLPSTMEWGYGFVNFSATDGCQNNTIKNCTITLQKVVLAPESAFYMAHHTAASATVLTIATTTGLNSSNKFYTNTILSCPFIPFNITGFNAATPFTYYDQNNDIGGASIATGNTIVSYGGLVGGSFYITTYGIYAVYQNNANVSYNTITQATDGLGGVGMYVFGTSSTFTCNNNNVTISGQSYSTTPSVHAGIYSNSTGANLTANNNTLNTAISASFVGSTAAYGIFFPATGNITATGNNVNVKQAVSGAFYGIYSSSGTTANISNNTITASTTSVAAVTGVFAAIYNSATASGGITVSNNSFNNINVNTTGSTYMVYCSNGTNNITVNNNAITGTFNRAGTSGTMYGYYNFGSPGVGTATITNNNFSNITLAGSTAFYGIYQATATTQIENVNNNTISNVTAATGTLIGIHQNYGAVGSSVNTNTVSNITGTGTVTGIQLGNATASLGLTVSGNNINGLSSTGASTVSGMIHTTGANTSIFKNKIYNLQSNNASGVTNGLTISAGTTVNVYNNLIGDLRALATSSATDAVRGINITSTTATSTLNIYYNTVALNAVSSGANFSSSGLFHTFNTTATTAALDLRNNIIVNNSTPNGTGITSAIRRSASTNLNNFAVTSNNNLLFAGGACASKFIYYDGTTGYQTLAAYKAFVTPRDALAISEDPSFLSTAGANAGFLHINTAIPTQAESAGATIATYLDDYDGNVRAGTPDIGADEFTGTVAVACAGTPTAGIATPANGTICSGSGTSICLSGQTTGAGITYQWQSAPAVGGPFAPINCATSSCYNTGNLAAGTYYFNCIVTCANGGASSTSNVVTIVVNPTPVVTINPAAPTICSGLSTGLTASGATTYTWSPATGLSGTTGATVTASPTVTTIYTVIGQDAVGCNSLPATVTVTVNQSPVISPLTATPATVCVGSNSQLQATVTGPLGYSANTVPFVPIASGTGTVVLANAGTAVTPMTVTTLDDGYWNNALTLPFTFNYYGTNYTTLSVQTNGVVSFSPFSTTTGYGSSPQMPNAATPNNLIGVFGDMDWSFGGNISGYVSGVAPNRIYVVNYNGTATPTNGGGFYNSGVAPTSLVNYQIQFFETSNKIQIHTTNITSDASHLHTMGIENVDGSTAAVVTGRNNTLWSLTNDGVEFTPNTFTYLWSPATFLSSTTISNPVATGVTATTTYTVTVTGNNGCATTSAPVTVTIDPATYTVTGGGSYCTGGAGLPVGLSGSQTGVNYQLVLNGATNVGALVPGTGAAISFGNRPAGTYTVVATNTTTTCSGTMAGNAVIALYPVVIITPTYTQPATCVTTDGAISIALSGAPGPYTFAWTGPGVVPAAQNQTNLIAGTYTVTVTDGNGCSATSVLTLVGPGGCSICPTLGSVTTNPTPSGCIGSPITLTASGLTSMGITYGIAFKSFTAATADPYTGGTVLATVLNGALTGGGTTATGTGTFAAANTYFVYAVLSPTPLDPSCRPSVVTNFVINPTPTAVATPAAQTACSGTAITTIALTGAVGGTTYNWTRDNTASVTGIAANGAGDIIGTLTNTTNAPITVTFTITPTAGGCPGTPITATVLVNPMPTATATPASQSICNGSTIITIVNTGSAVTGTVYNWTRNNTATVTGIAASGSGNISGALTNTTAAAITVTFTITPVANGCPGTPATATVLVNPTTTAAATPASQTICSGGTIVPIALTGVAGTTFTWTRDNSSATTVPGGIPASGSGTTISGFMVNTSNAPITVTFTIIPTANGCPGTPVTATVVVNPLASAVATPATQTTCSGSPITTIALTGNVTGATYTWTRDNTVNLTGIAASGTGNIAGTLVNTTTAPITTTFTITPSFAGCPGPAIIASVTVNPTPVVTQPANQTLCNAANTTAITFASTLAGTTYAWTNNTTSIGLAASGTGNIASFAAVNTGTTAVVATITVTPTLNGCTGTPKTFTITVNPTANVNAVTGQTLCPGATTTAVTFAGTVTGTTFTWTNNTPSIGLAASGTGTVPAFTAVNTTSAAVTATITVTPTAGTCAGTPRTFTITVNGISIAPTGATASNIALCGPGTADLTVQGGALGTGASWKWYSGSCGGTLVGTGATLTAVPVNGTATFWVRAEGTCNTTTCASVTVTVNAQPTITLSAAPYTSLRFPLTTAITANINPTAAGNTIVWLKDGVVINGAVTNVLSGITVDQLGSYRARVTTTAGCTALSAPLVIKDSASDKLFIMANPNNGQFKLRYYSNSISFGFLRTVTIYDSKGALVYSKAIPVTAPYSIMDIDIRKAGKGLFHIVLGDDKGKSLAEGKVVVQ